MMNIKTFNVSEEQAKHATRFINKICEMKRVCVFIQFHDLDNGNTVTLSARSVNPEQTLMELVVNGCPVSEGSGKDHAHKTVDYIYDTIESAKKQAEQMKQQNIQGN